MALFDPDPVTGQPEWERYALVASIAGLGVLGFLIFSGAFGKGSGSGTSSASGGTPGVSPSAPNAPLYYPTSDSYTSIAYNHSTTNNNVTNSTQSSVGISGQQLTILEDTLKTQQDLIGQLTHDLAGNNAPSPPIQGGHPPIGNGGNPIDGSGSGAPQSPSPTPAPTPHYQTVKVGTWPNWNGSLSGIAQHFGISLSSLESLNKQTIINTANQYGNPVPGGPYNNIFPGETLNIP